MTLSVKELIAEADHCVVCGLCLPHCPTYRKTGSEADSPRGRIQLMRAVALDILPNNERFKEHIDLCLSCRSCEAACPNSVNYGAMVDTSRALYTQKKSVWLALAKPFIRHRYLTYLLTWLLWLLQQLKLSGYPQRLLPAARLLPRMAKPVAWQSLYPATARCKGAVSLFLGCAGNALDSQTLASSIFVLNKLGFDAHIPKAQTCCGSIARQSGDGTEAAQLVARNAASFDPRLPVLTTASGCGAGLKDYLTSHTIQDISTFLMSCDWSDTVIAALKQKIYVQDSCSLRNVLHSQKAVYDLLKKSRTPASSHCRVMANAAAVPVPM